MFLRQRVTPEENTHLLAVSICKFVKLTSVAGGWGAGKWDSVKGSGGHMWFLVMPGKEWVDPLSQREQSVPTHQVLSTV